MTEGDKIDDLGRQRVARLVVCVKRSHVLVETLGSYARAHTHPLFPSTPFSNFQRLPTDGFVPNYFHTAVMAHSGRMHVVRLPFLLSSASLPLFSLSLC